MRRLYLAAGILLAYLVYSLVQPWGPARYDIVVYGGGFAGCAAARSAAAAAPGKKILLVVNDPVFELGGLGTSGGQNFTDIRLWQNQLVTQGSFSRWYNEAGQFYSTKNMAEIIKKDLQQFKNITILYSHSLQTVNIIDQQIKRITLAPIYRDKEGLIRWDEGGQTIAARVFVDASDDGRLARLSGMPLSVGRQDWPQEYLPPDEGTPDWARQQAATLMFKVTGVKTPGQPLKLNDLEFVRDTKGSWGLVGGKNTWQTNPVVTGFNEKFKSRGFSLKPLNAAQDGAGSSEWWVNMLLVYDVDGRFLELDRDMGSLPQGFRETSRTVDQAWREARELLTDPAFLEALREFKASDGKELYGFAASQLIMDEEKKPVVGLSMYIRESVHGRLLPLESTLGSENTNYALTPLKAQKAGKTGQQGQDGDNYQHRIGLAYYMMDINAYLPEDLKDKGSYQWPVTGHLRPDWLQNGGEPVNPVYLPYEMLTAGNVLNLLVPGYAVGCSALAWAELRVLPNLTVLGDAAGVAAARAVLKNTNPGGFRSEDISWMQVKLTQFGARLDK